ncbi:phage tail assembly protein T [Brenneria populi subsp. brevivirga]|uniref:phage tail assembly protein T n=1 Tax=Brenneria populi TaxID=1505588 RepID=UPI002E1710FB|nr:phage tail assembly protein T [Brenneria populi subsp. brevivirga]
MQLAREFNRPDWRTMLSCMSSTELYEWADFYRENYFRDGLLDAHFSQLDYLLVSVNCKHEMTLSDFSLLNPTTPDEAPDDETLMNIAESIPGGVRYGPISG